MLSYPINNLYRIVREVQNIRSMSEKSEELVFEMCKDIKALDTAKKNLTFSIKAITNFINILTTLEQLSVLLNCGVSA